jgi:hypothetical protein
VTPREMRHEGTIRRATDQMLTYLWSRSTKAAIRVRLIRPVCRGPTTALRMAPASGRISPSVEHLTAAPLRSNRETSAIVELPPLERQWSYLGRRERLRWRRSEA